ncbi:hypothetical protein FB567DRAFT_35445 [Paraphoma chrysanthemicola]|uniref:Uncharacterized protein n=1 Tax=Paraphoma chrysanthemicola TaxID=798071 RepID=A0A8K0RGE5_9PLEO|nr:hypothetical protein FB567DRAFT_35445 [Paraphoma chrysanthemicola]
MSIKKSICCLYAQDLNCHTSTSGSFMATGRRSFFDFFSIHNFQSLLPQLLVENHPVYNRGKITKPALAIPVSNMETQAFILGTPTSPPRHHQQLVFRPNPNNSLLENRELTTNHHRFSAGSSASSITIEGDSRARSESRQRGDSFSTATEAPLFMHPAQSTKLPLPWAYCKDRDNHLPDCICWKGGRPKMKDFNNIKLPDLSIYHDNNNPNPQPPGPQPFGPTFTSLDIVRLALETHFTLPCLKYHAEEIGREKLSENFLYPLRQEYMDAQDLRRLGQLLSTDNIDTYCKTNLEPRWPGLEPVHRRPVISVLLHNYLNVLHSNNVPQPMEDVQRSPSPCIDPTSSPSTLDNFMDLS